MVTTTGIQWYTECIEILVDKRAYCPAGIAHLAFEHNLYPEVKGSRKVRLKKQRIRMALGRLTRIHHFPEEGDTQVTILGKMTTPAWLGSRWKALLK